tara:strand:- start:644 stop:1258 length:615 start_codon:yes stop_codon:yes gene_type:complete
MLIFNTNIYENGISSILPVKCSNSWPSLACLKVDPYSLILSALNSDRKILRDLNQQPLESSQKRLEVLMPNASRFGNVKIITFISKRLLEGIVNRKTWLKMNSYHFCYLYDILSGYIDDYSYSNDIDRKNMIPELKGTPIDFNWFLNTYFFNTAFLIDPERFLDIEKLKKESLEEWSPYIFNVINGLAPSEGEMNLINYSEMPY